MLVFHKVVYFSHVYFEFFKIHIYLNWWNSLHTVKLIVYSFSFYFKYFDNDE